MAEYIDRKKIAAEVRKLSTHLLNEWDTLGVLALINRQPAADVMEVVRGNPIRHYQRFCNSDGEVIREIFDGWECPFCHGTGVLNYCPNCGAKMEVDGDV